MDLRFNQFDLLINSKIYLYFPTIRDLVSLPSLYVLSSTSPPNQHHRGQLRFCLLHEDRPRTGDLFG